MPQAAGGPARIFHESSAATADMAALPGVLGCRILRRTIQVRLRSNSLRFPDGKAISTVLRQQFVKYPDQKTPTRNVMEYISLGKGFRSRFHRLPASILYRL